MTVSSDSASAGALINCPQAYVGVAFKMTLYRHKDNERFGQPCVKVVKLRLTISW